MRIKLDENLPEELAPALTGMGHDVDTVRNEHLAGGDDSTIWRAAQSANRFLITQDLDFSDVRVFLPGTHAGLMLLRLRVASRSALIRRVESVFQSKDATQWAKCFVVVTERKIRVRRP